MDYRVIFKDTFLADLEQIVRGIAVHNPSAARKLGEMIIESGESLCFFPERHPKVRQRAGIRRFIVKNTSRCFTACSLNHEQWKCSIVGMAAGSPIRSWIPWVAENGHCRCSQKPLTEITHEQPKGTSMWTYKEREHGPFLPKTATRCWEREQVRPLDTRDMPHTRELEPA